MAMRYVTVGIGLLAVVVAFGAAPAKAPPPHIKAYLARQATPSEKAAAIKNFQKTLGEYRQTLARIRRGKINRVQTGTTLGPTGVITFPSREVRAAKAKEVQEQVTAATARLKGLKNGTLRLLAEMPESSPQVGHIGRLPIPGVHVEQIVGPRDMRILAQWFSHRRSGITYMTADVHFWVRGLSTQGLIDKSGTTLDGVFRIAGTKTYSTALGGTNTVFVLEPLDLTPYLPPKRPVRAAKPRKPVQD